MKNKLVELVNVSKSFGSTKVLDELCLEVKENEFLTLLGPSGCVVRPAVERQQRFALSVDLRNQTVEKSFLTERILQMFQRISEI